MAGTGAKSSFDICVIGAGVFGAWVSYTVQRAGKSVLLIDAYGAGNSRSSSGDESRIIRMGYGPDEIYTRSARQSLARWKQFAAEHGQQVFVETGVLWLAHHNDPYALNTLDTLEREKVRFEKLRVSEIARRFPQIGLDHIAWGMLERESGVLLGRRAVQAVVKAAVKAGVEFTRDAVLEVTGGANLLKSVTTVNGKSISAGGFVFACGPWLPKLFPDVVGPRIQPTRQEVFYFGAPAGDARFAPRQLPTWIDFKDEAYGLPELDGRGVKLAIDRHGPPCDPDTVSRVVSAEGLDEARRYLARRLPALKNAPVIEARVCQYENTSNGDFLIDRHPQWEDVWLVGGGSGHGFKHGPAVGEYVAARIQGDAVGVENRFSLSAKMKEQQRAVY